MMGAGGPDWGTEMSEQLATDLGHLVEELAKEARPTEPANLARLGEQVASLFKAKSDEVAVLALTGQDKFLKFIIPEKLQAIGTLPMTSTSALAVRTAREKRPELFNNFAGTRHATVFEGVPLGRRHDEPIQKLMSAPIFVEDKVIGVVQISRKGRSSIEAGPDFTQQELRLLVSITGALAAFIKLCKVS